MTCRLGSSSRRTPAGTRRCPAWSCTTSTTGQHHLGKAEVAGLAGEPLQAFGPALARRGVVVLAPDSICFEDRRPSGPGTEPREGDFIEHLKEASYRLVSGRLLMTTVRGDAARALSALRSLPAVDPARAGVLGHSYGGNTTLFHAALDERVRLAAASGAAASYRRRIEIARASSLPR